MEQNTAQARILAKVEVSNSCWQWTAAVNAYGYGVIGVPGTHRTMLAHRAAFEAWVGPIPDGLDLDHLCRTRRCVNPAHLEPVSRRTNLLRGLTITAANAAKTACPKGHPYEGRNLLIRSRNGRPVRRCRTCDLARKADYRRRRAAA
jgi:hypothetical protein